jgi:hypothetical protein
LRTVSGLIGHKNRDRYQLKTAVATIGIRGTEFTVNYNDQVLLMTTNHGSVDVCNQGGCLNAITGQTIVVAGVGSSPKPSSKAATAAAAPAAGGNGKAVFAADDSIAADLITAVDAAKNPPPAGLPASGTVVALSTDGVTGASNSQVFKATSIVYGASNALVSATDGNTNLLLGSATYKTFKNTNNEVIALYGQTDVGTTRYDYIIGATPNVLALGASGLTGTYNVGGLIGASSAPYLSSATGGLTTIGAANSVTGNLTANFGSGTIGYNLNVPTTNNNIATTYTAIGTGNINANGVFNTDAKLNLNNQVNGSFLGKNAEGAGLVYVINAPNVNGTNGSVNGSVVLIK